MTFKIVDFTPGSAVASAGTFAPSYPTGYTAGSFAAYGHTIYAEGLQKLLKQDDGDFSISFGASTFTVTYNGSTSLPASKGLKIQLNSAGPDNLAAPDMSNMKRMNLGGMVRIDLGAPKATDTDGIAESQSVSAGAAFVLNGVQSDLYGDVAPIYLDVPRCLTAAWTTTSILTITGKDEYGDVIIEKSASGTSHTGTKAFASIDSITSSASITSAIVGFNDVIGLPVYVDKVGRIIAEFQDGVQLPKRGGKVYIPWEIEETQLLAPTAEQIVCPVAGFIAGVRGVVQKAVTTGGDLTVEVGGVAVTGLSLTVANGDAAGTRYSDTPTTWHSSTTVVAAGDALTITPGSPFATAGEMNGILEIDVLGSSLIDGTFVAGVQTLPTATTGDTKGTYDPTFPCDGAAFFSLLVSLPDTTYKGVDNYDG